MSQHVVKAKNKRTEREQNKKNQERESDDKNKKNLHKKEENVCKMRFYVSFPITSI